MNLPVIALGRQFGSGGREVGRRLAEGLGCPFYDRELITLAAQRAQLREEIFAGKDEKAGNPWLFTGVYEGGPLVRKGRSAEDILFDMQSQVILELAEKGLCVIVGRCGDYVLRRAGVPVCSLYLCAPFAWRVAHRMELEHIPESQATDEVRKLDRQRRKYYDTYTGGDWGAPENYDLCINTSVLGVEGTAAALLEHLKGSRGLIAQSPTR